MGEAGLSPSEVGKEIAEHRHRAADARARVSDDSVPHLAEAKPE